MGGLLSKTDPASEQQQRMIANNDHAHNLSHIDDRELDPEYIDKMTGSDLDQATVSMLSNMLSKDWVLSNLSEAEVNEERWLARCIKLQIEALHPREDSIWQGELRKYCSGKADNSLTHLDSKQRAIIFQLIQGHVARVTRGRDGWQQDKFNESLTVSERRDTSKDEKGGWFSR